MISADVQWFLFCFSVYCLVLFPVIVWLRAVRVYKSNPGLHDAIRYQFSDNNVTVKGGEIETKFEWQAFARVQQTKNFLLLYNINRAAYFIKLKDLTQEQINFIKLKVRES